MFTHTYSQNELMPQSNLIVALSETEIKCECETCKIPNYLLIETKVSLSLAFTIYFNQMLSSIYSHGSDLMHSVNVCEHGALCYYDYGGDLNSWKKTYFVLTNTMAVNL